MKPYLFLLPFLLCTINANAQREQTCKVRELNSGGKPIANVSAVFEGSKAAISESDGTMRFLFEGKDAGESIYKVSIYCKDYELVNEKDLERVQLGLYGQLSADIIMARVGTVDSLKAIYLAAVEKLLEAAFNREKANLKQAYKSKKLKADTYNEQLDRLNTIYGEQRQNTEVIADQFARVSFDDVDSISKDALVAFKAGDINKAISLLEMARPAKRIKVIAKKQKRSAHRNRIFNPEEQSLRKEKRQAIDKLHFLADMYAIQCQPDKGESQYDALLESDKTDLDILEDVAVFYREHQHYKKILSVYALIKAHPKAAGWQVAIANGVMGDTYQTTGNLSAALEAYNNCLDFYQKEQPKHEGQVFYKANWATTYEKLGEVYTDLDSLNKALACFEQRYQLGQELYAVYPYDILFKKGLSTATSKLGEIHSDLGHWDKALSFFEEDLKLSQELCTAYPDNADYQNGLSIAYDKLGDTYTSLGNFDIAIDFFEKGLELSKALCAAYPYDTDFKNGLAVAYSHLGDFYKDKMDNKVLAKTYFEECYALWYKLSIIYPEDLNFQENLKWVVSKLAEL